MVKDRCGYVMEEVCFCGRDDRLKYLWIPALREIHLTSTASLQLM